MERKKKLLTVLLVILFGASAAAGGYFLIAHPSQATEDQLFGIYGQYGGNFHVNMGYYVPAQNGQAVLVKFDGIIEYRPKNDTITGTGTLYVPNGDNYTSVPATIEYNSKSKVFLVSGDNINYIAYPAPNATLAFYKGLIALYEYAYHHGGHWKKTYLTAPNGERILAYYKDFYPGNFFEQQALQAFNALGQYGPYTYRLYKIEQNGYVIDVKLVVMNRNQVVFWQEVGLAPNQPKIEP